MATNTVVLLDEAQEAATHFVDLQFLGDDGDSVEPNTIEAKLFDLITLAVINGRTGPGEAGQDIKDTNGGVLGPDGHFTLRLDPADNAFVSADPGKRLERHGLWIKWTWGAGYESWVVIVFVVRRKGVPD